MSHVMQFTVDTRATEHIFIYFIYSANIHFLWYLGKISICSPKVEFIRVIILGRTDQ